MATPPIPVTPPERLTLPDVYRLDRMPSLPAWVTLRVGSMRDVSQATIADGKHRTVPTLPASLTLSPAERAELERYVAGLGGLCDQTPANGVVWEADVLVMITEMMYALPSNQQSEAAVAAVGKWFLRALDDVPTWAVAAALNRWNKADCGSNERGQPYDYHWRPAPAELRRLSLIEMWRLQGQAQLIRRLLRAERLIEFSEDHCARMREKLCSLARRLRGI
jgi:hypothetical protein